MADISFLVGENFTISNLSGSGIGWYGNGGFGTSVATSAYPDSAYITDSTGTVQGAQIDNNKYVSTSGVSLGGGSGILLTSLPNYQSTLNIRFTGDTPIKTQNVRLYFYDRTSENNSPSGVVVKACEIIHPGETQINTGSGSALWLTPAGSSYISLTSSPGTSGFRPNGPDTSDTNHDWFLAISPSPTSAGSKDKFGLLVKLEYV